MQTRNERPIIGYLTVTEARGVLRSHEYAGAGERWDLDAARIPIHAPHDGTMYWFTGRRPGTLRERWFQNRIGAALGSDNRETPDERGFYGVQFDAFGAGRAVRDGRLELVPGWVAVDVGDYSDGTRMLIVGSVERLRAQRDTLAASDRADKRERAAQIDAALAATA